MPALRTSGAQRSAPPRPLPRRLPLAVLLGALATGIGIACSAPDPGAFEITPRRTASAPSLPTATASTPPPPTDGGPKVDGGPAEGGTGGSAIFDKPYAAPGAPDTSTIASKHPAGTNGPTSIAMAKTTDCMTCHRTGGTAPGAVFLIAGVTKPNAEVGVKLTAAAGKVVTTRATAEGYFYIESGDSIAGAKVGVRDSATNFSDMSGPLGSGACNQPACHGGSQGDVFKGK